MKKRIHGDWVEVVYALLRLAEKRRRRVRIVITTPRGRPVGEFTCRNGMIEPGTLVYNSSSEQTDDPELAGVLQKLDDKNLTSAQRSRQLFRRLPEDDDVREELFRLTASAFVTLGRIGARRGLVVSTDRSGRRRGPTHLFDPLAIFTECVQRGMLLPKSRRFAGILDVCDEVWALDAERFMPFFAPADRTISQARQIAISVRNLRDSLTFLKAAGESLDRVRVHVAADDYAWTLVAEEGAWVLGRSSGVRRQVIMGRTLFESDDETTSR